MVFRYQFFRILLQLGVELLESQLLIYDHYDFLGIWEDIREKVGEEGVFFIIDNAKTHLPFRRWQKAGNCSDGNSCLFTRSQSN